MRLNEYLAFRKLHSPPTPSELRQSEPMDSRRRFRGDLGGSDGSLENIEISDILRNEEKCPRSSFRYLGGDSTALIFFRSTFRSIFRFTFRSTFRSIFRSIFQSIFRAQNNAIESPPPRELKKYVATFTFLHLLCITLYRWE